MSNQCPACRTAIPIWRWSGPIVKYQRKPGSSWLRFSPELLYCRKCGVELRRTLLPLGRVALGLIIASIGVITCLAFLSDGPLPSLDRYRKFAVILAIPLYIALSFVVALWGTQYQLAGATADDVVALSNNRWKRP
jgi:hypothetical protein